ncbi:hypothetical protein [Myxococcus xanthus]|uniref:hypothetical protein n=1 Tax=Myxococcus xanthus TaxID=34 RepID=UPI001CEC6F1B|nr:hypothetical protein [Myxococcus xanthus]
MKPWRRQHFVSVSLLLAVSGCGSATVSTVGAKPSAKWVGPTIPSPAGGSVQTTIYYGPWLCSAALMARCERRCVADGHVPLLGCIWLADIKGDWQGRFMALPAAAGGRLAVTHCCCDYPKVSDLNHRRETWEDARKTFRRKWSSEFGDWPKTETEHWPGHHIFDLAHGGAPLAPDNVIPVPPGVHRVINSAYPACYDVAGKWRAVGPERPYVE